MTLPSENAFEETYLKACALAERAPRPAKVGNVLFGTAGWTDPSLIKTRAFYPRGVSKSDARLNFYSSQFPLVEVDATYYSILEPKISSRWVECTRDDFAFNVKAHASMTDHPVDLRRLPRELRDRGLALLGGAAQVRARELPLEFKHELEQGFARFLEPLLSANRLSAVLCQFPPWFDATRGNAKRLEGLRERWPALPIAVEFRNPTWLEGERRGRLMSLLAELGFSYVAVDEPSPDGRGVPPTLLIPNPELALLRMHGQNAPAWANRRASVKERFNYLYSPAELSGWVSGVERLSREAKRVHVVFNNCVRDFAVVNARGLAALLDEQRQASGGSGA